MKRNFVPLLALAIATSTIPADELLILEPHKGKLCREGGLCPIVWKSDYNGTLCIEAGIGGKSLGLLNDCDTPASQGRFFWRIPKGLISNFGIEKDELARILLFPKDHPEQMSFSDYFTITATADSDKSSPPLPSVPESSDSRKTPQSNCSR